MAKAKTIEIYSTTFVLAHIVSVGKIEKGGTQFSYRINFSDGTCVVPSDQEMEECLRHRRKVLLLLEE